MNSKLPGWLEIAGGIALAIAAEPIHEAGHAVAARVFTGAWPRFGFWAVHPTKQFESAGTILAVLAAGDAAVIVWWALAYLIARRRPEHTWVLIGPTFMAGLALLNWLAASVFIPFGYERLGASDAVKFLAVSRLRPWQLAAVVTGVVLAVAITTAKQFRPSRSLSTPPEKQRPRARETANKGCRCVAKVHSTNHISP